MDELKRNGSGYYDETAYKAMKQVEKGEKMDIKRGEIWEVSMNGGIREMLCIKAFEKYAVGLLLSQEETEENSIMIKSRTKMYADVGRTIYAYNDNIRSYIKTLPENDMDYIIREIAKTLELEPPEPEVQPFQTELIPFTYKKQEETCRLETERDVYKELYTDLMAKVTKI